MTTNHKSDTRTETVTKTRPMPASSLPGGMPIADKRVGFGKGGGIWLWVAAGAAAFAVVLFVVALWIAAG